MGAALGLEATVTEDVLPIVTIERDSTSKAWKSGQCHCPQCRVAGRSTMARPVTAPLTHDDIPILLLFPE